MGDGSGVSSCAGGECSLTFKVCLGEVEAEMVKGVIYGWEFVPVADGVSEETCFL